MSNPYLFVGEHRCTLMWIAIVGSFVMIGWLSYHGAPLKKRTPWPPGILALEFCLNQERANELLADWKKPDNSTPDRPINLIDLAIKDVYWDFLFIIAYSSAIALVCGYAADGKPGGWMAFLLVLAWLQFGAAAFDVIENVSMLKMLKAGSVSSSTLPLVTTVCASLKFLIIIVGVLIGLFGVLIEWIS